MLKLRGEDRWEREVMLRLIPCRAYYKNSNERERERENKKRKARGGEVL